MGERSLKRRNFHSYLHSFTSLKCKPPFINKILVYREDLKSFFPQGECGFDSHPGHMYLIEFEDSVKLGWVEGFEPSATGTTIRRSTKLSYTHRGNETSLTGSACRQVYRNQSPAFFHNSSTRCFTSADIVINGGHGRVNPSPAHFRVASIPIFEP